MIFGGIASSRVLRTLKTVKKPEALFGLVRIPLDALAVAASLLLSYRLRQANIDLIPGVQLLEPAKSLPLFPYYIATFVLPGIALFLALAALFRLYVLRATMSAWIEIGRIILISLLWMVLVVAWYFLAVKQLFFSRVLLFHSLFFIILFVVLLRASLINLQRALLREGIGKLLVLSLGTLPIAACAKETLQEDVHYHYLGHLPNLDALKRILYQHPIDLVLQTDPDAGSDDTLTLIDYCRSHQVGYAFLPPVLADVPHLLAVERLGLLPMVRFRPTPLDGWGRVMKRVFDIVASFLLIVVLSPFLLLIAIGVLVDSGWPVFYVSVRVGEQGRRRIRLFKFRSMIKNADAVRDQLLISNHRRDGPLFKMRNDPRVTRFGRFLRRFSLDELPQLFNVFFGQLSLVGPRPHLSQEVEKYSLKQRRVFAVKPGITGLAQVSGRSDLSFDEEVRLDLQYIEEWSQLLDLWILWRTIFTVCSRKGAD